MSRGQRIKKQHDLLTMSGTKKEVEKVPKKKVPRTEKGKELISSDHFFKSSMKRVAVPVLMKRVPVPGLI